MQGARSRCLGVGRRHRGGLRRHGRAKDVAQPRYAAVFGRRLLDDVPEYLFSQRGGEAPQVTILWETHLKPRMMRPRMAKLSAQKKEIQSGREPKGGAKGIEFLNDGRAKISPLQNATFPNSACIQQDEEERSCEGSCTANAHLAEFEEREAEDEGQLENNDEPQSKDDKSRVQFEHDGSRRCDAQLVGKTISGILGGGARGVRHFQTERVLDAAAQREAECASGRDAGRCSRGHDNVVCRVIPEAARDCDVAQNVLVYRIQGIDAFCRCRIGESDLRSVRF
jgi:hypothetical protein